MVTHKDCNSIANQEIKRKFVEREVLTCFSYEMDELLRKEVINFEDIENLYLDTEKVYKDYGYDSPEAMQDDGASLQEIYEWWIVSRFLYEKLKDKGEPILQWGNNYYWGRGCTGQAILLDDVISEICKDMEILDGQKYSWSK